MIEINLLPEEIRKKKKAAPKIDVSKINLKAIPIINIALIIVGGIAAIQIFLFVVGAAAGSGFNIMSSEYKDIFPKKQKTQILKIQMDKMRNKVAVIDELMVKRFSWATKLDDLNDSMTPGVWLTALEYDEKLTEQPRATDANLMKKAGAQESKTAMEKVLLRYLIISGAASSMGEEGMALIGRFIKSLKSNSNFYSDFNDIELGTIMRERVEDQEVMTFKITCLFKIK